ncbi:MAG: hypothetical protein Q7J07_00970, partial [Pelolinea sp.]|nr:hypothetical protein [Pelolinea sp.]
MENFSFNQEQLSLINSPIESSIFLSGPSGSGKTTAALSRINNILKITPGFKILIISPQQSLADPYRNSFIQNSHFQGSLPTITTINGLSREMIRKFWPLVSSEMGFRSPGKSPTFLSLESAQYCLSKIVDPLLDNGYFQSVTIDRNRLFSQILDNLNKTSLAGIPINEIAYRLKSTSNDISALHMAFDQAQECAIKFREYCLDHNLIDFSLNISLFRDHVWPLDYCKNYLQARFSTLIADNIEEDTPFAHVLIKDLIKLFQSSLLIYDEGGGFRSFLGADPVGARNLIGECEIRHQFSKEFISPQELKDFRLGLDVCIARKKNNSIKYQIPSNSELSLYRFYPEMISETCSKVKQLLDDGAQPNDIVILSPYLSDSLKFSLTEKLKSMQIPTHSSRPSRMYMDTPEAKAMIAFAKLSHPDWNMKVSFFEFRNFIMQVIPDLDIVRADLIAKHLFSSEDDDCPINSFDMINEIRLQERITFQIGEKIEILRKWLIEYIEKGPIPLDIFYQNVYGQVLSQSGFNFHNDYDAANLISKLIQSIRSFRIFTQEVFNTDPNQIGKEYLHNIELGLIPSSFMTTSNDENAVLIAPAHTFLMENRPAAYQFWLDIGSLGWWERLYQPLTNPYVFRPQWSTGETWTDQMDYSTNQQAMQRLVNGLLSRCSNGVVAAGV